MEISLPYTTKMKGPFCQNSKPYSCMDNTYVRPY